MGTARVLGEFIAALSFETLPELVIKASKERILDFLGVALLGYRIGSFRPLFDILDEEWGKYNCTVIGKGKGISCRKASLINSFMAHSTYYEDGSRVAGGHPSSVVIPSALAVAERIDTSGKALIEAITAGYEIFVRIGKASISQTNRGFHPTATLGPLAAAAAGSKILRLNENQTTQALAMAVPLGAGLLNAFQEPSSQPLQVGRGCEAGVITAFLASKGMRGVETSLENAFFKAYCPESISVQQIIDGLGKEYMLPTTYLKIHGGCRHNHPATDGVASLMAKHDLIPEQVKSVSVKTYSLALALYIKEPQTPSEAMFNIPFSIALQLHTGNANFENFSARNLHSPAIRALMQKVKVEADSDIDKLFPGKRMAVVKVTTYDGRELTDSIEFPKGEPENPLPSTDLEGKFLRLAEPTLGCSRSKQCVEMIRGFEKIKNVSTLMKMLY